LALVQQTLNPFEPAYLMQNQQETPSQPKSDTKFKAFVTGAIIAGSALVGGLAVVLWNRQTLSGLRQHHEPRKKPSAQANDDSE
jgi:hypothetical protein